MMALAVFLVPLSTCVFAEDEANPTPTPAPETGPEAPFTISTIQDFSGAGGWYVQEKGKRIELKGFRIAFKVKNDSVTSLDTARVYLYDSKKVLMQALDNYSSAEKTMAGVPNMITSLKGLQKNKVYNLLFPYPKNTRWKYAVAIIGNSQQIVAETLPSSAKIADFDFKEKPLVVNP